MNKKVLFLCFLCFFMQHIAHAASIKGGSISYACLGNNKYKITARINRECSDAGITSYKMDVFNGLGSVAMSASRVSIKDVSPVCSKVSPPCSSPNQVSAPGIEEHVYEATVDFNSSTFNTFLQNRLNNCEVYFSFETSGRDTSINTMSHGQFFIVAMLDLCFIDVNACNSSPSDKDVNSLNICSYQPFSYNPGLNDITDNDLLVIDTLAPKTAKNTAEQYVAGYSRRYPVTPYCPLNPGVKNCSCSGGRGICFNPSSGDMTFTPTLQGENAAIVFRANEYRMMNGKSELIGFSEKEVIFSIKACPDNNPPSFIGNNKYSICEGVKLCFFIQTKDEPFLPKQTTLDTVELTWNQGIPGATFTIVDPSAREKEAQFCWQTKIGDAKSAPYTFTAKAKDDNCPVPSVANRGYSITVKPKATDIRKYTKSFKGKTIFEAIVTSDTVNYKLKNYTFKFTIRDSTNSGVPYFMSYNKRDSFKFTQAGTYVIEHQISNPPLNCPLIYTDTFKVTAQHLAAIPSLLEQRISIVPNPAHDILSIVSEDFDLSGISVKIYSIDGKLVFEAIPENSQINVSSLSKGMYILEMNSEGVHIYQRIIIE